MCTATGEVFGIETIQHVCVTGAGVCLLRVGARVCCVRGGTGAGDILSAYCPRRTIADEIVLHEPCSHAVQAEARLHRLGSPAFVTKVASRGCMHAVAFSRSPSISLSNAAPSGSIHFSSIHVSIAARPVLLCEREALP